jgi:hypothetical protein
VRRLVLMLDYDADPLWDDRSGVMVPLSTLPISKTLRERLTAWRQRWEEAAWEEVETGEEQPLDSAHQRDRHDLWLALRDELAGEYEVGVEADSPGRDTRVHVVWEPGGEPELPTWHKRSKHWRAKRGDRPSGVTKRGDRHLGERRFVSRTKDQAG